MLVDSHCHLDFPEFESDLEGVLARAAEAGIGKMLTISTRLDRFPKILEIAERHDNVWCSVGIHPHEAEHDPDVSVARLIELAQHPKVVGFGETGLDYFYEHSPRDIQQAVFRTHIRAARQAGLPIIIHNRDSDDDTAAILTEEAAQGPFTGLIHCFSASRQLADTAIKLGLYLSLSGILTFKKAEELRQIIADQPLDRLLVETDAPFLAPLPHRGKRNEPAFTALTAAKLAEIKGVGRDQLAQATTANFHRLFTKVSG